MNLIKRLILEDWHHALPYIGFAISSVIFVIAVVWALRMKQEKVDHMAHLPLENDHQSPSNRNH